MVRDLVTPVAPPSLDADRAVAAWQAILEAVPEAIAVVSRAGVILELKPTADVPVGGEAHTAIGKSVHDVPGVPAERIMTLLARAFETRQTLPMEYEVTVNGMVRSRAAALRAINDEEAVWVARDVTAERDASRRMAFADRMASLGTLAAGVAHELNNPLAYVMANLEFIERELLTTNAVSTEVASALAESLDGLERMGAIVSSLREFSHPHDDATALVNVADVVAGAVKLASLRLDGRAALDVELPSEPLEVRGVEARLSQVFVNLLLNAIAALDPAKSATNVIRVRAAAADHGVVVEVCDNGCGVPAAIRSRVFDPFFTTKAVGEATGLGLSIAQQIVRGAGGEIELESEEGRGATFRVVLPAAPPWPSIVSSIPSSGRDVARILVVDDDPAVRSGLTRLLARWDITAVASARAAILALESDAFDLVLCDVLMPRVSGVAFYLDVAARWPGREATVVLMTGAPLTDVARLELGTRAPIVLSKPFDAATVSECLSLVRRACA